MAGSSPREREVGSLWCSAYPRLVGVASPRLLPPPCNPSLNPFTRHASLSSFLPSFLLSLTLCSRPRPPPLPPLRPCLSPFPPRLSSYISFIDVFTPPTHASRCTYALCSATWDRNRDTSDKKSWNSSFFELRPTWRIDVLFHWWMFDNTGSERNRQRFSWQQEVGSSSTILTLCACWNRDMLHRCKCILPLNPPTRRTSELLCRILISRIGIDATREKKFGFLGTLVYLRVHF